jgi:hypothetical protein
LRLYGIDLALGPEKLAELPYTVLIHCDSDANWDEIPARIGEQIEDARAQAEALTHPCETRKLTQTDRCCSERTAPRVVAIGFEPHRGSP